MLNIEKVEEPPFFSKFKRKENPREWGDCSVEVKKQLKAHLLKNEQNIGDILLRVL